MTDGNALFAGFREVVLEESQSVIFSNVIKSNRKKNQEDNEFGNINSVTDIYQMCNLRVKWDVQILQTTTSMIVKGLGIICFNCLCKARAIHQGVFNEILLTCPNAEVILMVIGNLNISSPN